jgi:hypothetical protein
MVVSLIALVVASSGTAIAAATLTSGDKLIKKHSLSGNRLRNHTITGKQVNLSKLGKVPRAAQADHATSAGLADLATNATMFGGLAPSSFVNTCADGSVAAVGSWYTDTSRPGGFPMDPNFTAPNQFGGEGGFACNGATPLLAKESTGAYRMEFSKELPNQGSYLAFVNPDARAQVPLYAQSNFDLAANGHSVWDIFVFNKNGTPADPYYLEVMLVKLT